ncbi:DNA-3-methyladenine glycosylase [Candidatus Hepatincolaceae symbiont of Richtersius coronifer]
MNFPIDDSLLKSLKLEQEFFLKPTEKVALELLGKEINFYGKKAIITETEAYNAEDVSSHSYKKIYNPNAPFTMFLAGGYSYVYLIYGIWHCLNFVTEEEGKGCAVLIRGIFDVQNDLLYHSKPGLLCKYLGISKEYNGLDICKHPDFYVKDLGLKLPYEKGRRIGLNKKNGDYQDLKRFYLLNAKESLKKLIKY